MMANIAMHLSRRHKAIFFAVHTLRPGDGSVRPHRYQQMPAKARKMLLTSGSP